MAATAFNRNRPSPQWIRVDARIGRMQVLNQYIDRMIDDARDRLLDAVAADEQDMPVVVMREQARCALTDLYIADEFRQEMVRLVADEYTDVLTIIDSSVGSAA